MMHRNLDRRVEVMVRVTDARQTAQLAAIFESAMDPATRCWVLNGNGDWTASPAHSETVRDHQTEMLARHWSKE
jgi:polyphosphate kinase